MSGVAPIPAAIFWSGGKDSALALWRTLQTTDYQVRYLIVTVNEPLGRVSMHGVRKELIKSQAEAIGIPIKWMPVAAATDNTAYETALNEVFDWLKAEGINHVIYGDVFLDDLRQYRDGLLSQAGITGIYPLWKEDCGKLAREVIDTGIATLLVCVDGSKLPQSFAGRLYDNQLLADLPPEVDPCGENGEFHTFVFDAPYFSNPVVFEKGELTERSYAGSQHSFWFLDLKEGLVF